MPHSHQIYDSDKHFVIDPITRNITNNSSKITIMQYDHNSERFTFEIPRVIEGHDMSLSDVVRVHFINIGSIKTNTNSGVYEVDDVNVSSDDPDTITFSWLISGASTKYNGSLNFAIRFYCLSDESVIEYSWGTNIYSGINVANSIDNSETIAEDYVDVLEQWKQSLQHHISDDAIHITSEERSEWNSKQDKLIAGENITIAADGKTISAAVGSTVELDTTLSEAGKAADAKAVGDALAGKQDTISDLATIRSGAAKGATALQSVPNTYRTASEQDTIDSGKVDKVTGKGLSTNDYTDAAKAKVDALAPVATSGNYNDLTDKPTIPAPVTEQTVSGWGFTKNTGTYSKPTGGIPKTDLANDVQASLNKAETALQEHQSLAAYRTAEAQDLIDNGKQDKLIAGENITISADGRTISATGGGSSVPKPLTYDYMPEGYPTKSSQTTVLLEEQEIAFSEVEQDVSGVYAGSLTHPFSLVSGQTYTVNWDGTEYECVASRFQGARADLIGNPSVLGEGEDTGEPFLYGEGMFATLDTSPSHTISVTTSTATIIPMSEEFIPTTAKLPNPNPLTFTGAVTGSYDGSEALTVKIPSGGGVQSDWNQNDSTAADYVKNRPFYTGNPVETVIIPTTTVAFSENSGLMSAAWPENFDLVDGQTYTISWDDTDYVCTGILFNNVPVLGNLILFGAGENTGEPFLFVNQGQWIVASTESATEHIIGIKVSYTPIVTLNENYLPKASADGYGVVKKSDIVSAYNFPAQVQHDQMVDAITAFKTGNASIVWDGKKVINAFYNSSDDTISVSFAKEPLRRVTFNKTSDGFYKDTLGSSTYEEVQGSQVRITNDNDATAVLMTEGIPGSTTLSVAVEKFSVSGGEFSGHALILYSSTYGSDKKFKITVDDSGVPSFTNTEDSTEVWAPSDAPTKTSQLENDAGYLTLATLPKYEGVVGGSGFAETIVTDVIANHIVVSSWSPSVTAVEEPAE